MYIKPGARPSSAWTLVEMMISVGVFSIAGLALSTIFLYSIRSYQAMANYAVLDQRNRQAMDQLTYEVRQAQQVTGCTSNATTRTLSLLNSDNLNVTYTFDGTKQSMVRSASDGSSRVMLTNCNLLNFGLFMRPPTNGTFDVYPINSGNNWTQTVKVVQLTWKTSMQLYSTTLMNSEDIQTARIVIRKQQD
jgi:type II secretory pathway pseudopilin PulG